MDFHAEIQRCLKFQADQYLHPDHAEFRDLIRIGKWPQPVTFLNPLTVERYMANTPGSNPEQARERIAALYNAELIRTVHEEPNGKVIGYAIIQRGLKVLFLAPALNVEEAASWLVATLAFTAPST